MKGRDMVSASLRLIGAIAPGESLEAAEATDGLAALNRLLDSWSNEQLLIHRIVREVFPFVPNQGAYTMGTGGNFDTPRPMRLVRASVQIDSSNPATELPMRIITVEEYALLTLKGFSSTFPTDVYPEGTYPLEVLNFYPIPTEAKNFVVYSWKQLTQIATLDTDITFPPGYERALIYNLAIEVAPEYGKNPMDLVVTTAVDAKAQLKRMNARPSYLRVDNALMGRDNKFDIYKGDTTL